MNVSDGGGGRQPGPPKFTLHPVVVLTMLAVIVVSGVVWAVFAPSAAPLVIAVVTAAVMMVDVVRQL